jgi:hypothetical protein
VDIIIDRHDKYNLNDVCEYYPTINMVCIEREINLILVTRQEITKKTRQFKLVTIQYWIIFIFEPCCIYVPYVKGTINNNNNNNNNNKRELKINSFKILTNNIIKRWSPLS